MKKKIVLAFSGGLDTTYCLVYLCRILNYEVHAVSINTGGINNSDVEQLKMRAQVCGAASFTCIDVRQKYYDECLKFLVYGNVLKNGTYPLSVSAERIVQAIAIAEFANAQMISSIAHGSTGAGNDQVRFDMIFRQLLPQVEIITPIRDLKLSREEEINYLRTEGIVFNFEKAHYSINKGLWGTSVGGKETLSSHLPLPEDAWPEPVTKQNQEELELQFEKGNLLAVNQVRFENSVAAIEYLTEITKGFGIGRDIHVGDTIIGSKGRVGFEAAAAVLIIKAHHLLEKHVLTKWQLFLKDQLSTWYGNWLHEGQMLDPVMRDIEAFLESSQSTVNGKVFLTLYPYRFVLNGIESEFDLMAPKFGSYGESAGKWTGEDVKGFIKIFGNQTSMVEQVKQSIHHAKN